MSPFDWSCVVHVHSTYSDGTATIPELVNDAAANGRDAILLTDHDDLSARADGWQGWHGDVLLVVGTEISTAGGHLLAFGIDESPDGRLRPGSDAAAYVARHDGICFAAHPFSTGSAMSKTIGRPHPWERLEDDNLTGIELWSLLTDTAESWRNPVQGLRFMRDPERRFAGPERRRLDRWDQLGAERPLVGIGGLDAHQSGGRLLGRRPVSPIPNSRYFGSLATHVITDEPPTGDATSDQGMLLAALAAGRCYLGMDWSGPTSGFRFEASRGSRTAAMGSEVDAGPWTLRARLPGPARLMLLRDGRVIQESIGAEAIEAEAEAPGVYRVEAWLADGRRELPWVISNPIYLRSAPD